MANKPVPGTQREPVEDGIIGGVFVPKHTPIIIPIYAFCHDQSIWGEDCDEFKPERWESPPPKASLAFLTFLAGPRSCIGRAFAMAEFKCMLAVLIQQFRFECDADYNPKKNPVIVSKPVGGMHLRMSRWEK